MTGKYLDLCQFARPTQNIHLTRQQISRLSQSAARVEFGREVLIREKIFFPELSLAETVFCERSSQQAPFRLKSHSKRHLKSLTSANLQDDSRPFRLTVVKMRKGFYPACAHT